MRRSISQIENHIRRMEESKRQNEALFGDNEWLTQVSREEQNTYLLYMVDLLRRGGESIGLSPSDPLANDINLLSKAVQKFTTRNEEK